MSERTLVNYAEEHYGIVFSQLSESEKGYYLSMAWYDLNC